MKNRKDEFVKKPIEIKLNYDALIAILQGKNLHIKTFDVHVILHPPFDGTFLTHEQLTELLYAERHKSFATFDKIKEEQIFEQKDE